MKAIESDLGFSHEWVRDTTESLCKKVDDAGGWNPDAACVQFYHSETRSCKFSAVDRNSGWWTTVLTRDEYYWNAISAEFKESIRRKTVRAIRDRIA